MRITVRDLSRKVKHLSKVICKMLSEIKLGKNLSDNLQSFLEISPVEKNNEKLPESIKSSNFVSHRARMSGEFDSKKDSHSTKLERWPQIFVKLSFRELCGSNLPGLHPFDNMAIID